VLAVQSRAGARPAGGAGRLRSGQLARAVDVGSRAIPPEISHEALVMNTIQELIDSSSAPGTAFARTLERTDIGSRTPAALAAMPDARTSSSYVFLSSERVIEALGQAGFVPVSAAQTRSRRSNPLSARHAIRFRRRYETVSLRDCIPE
jgi:hypothetical protein